MATYRNVIGWINNPNPSIVRIRLGEIIEIPLQNGDIIEDSNISQHMARSLFAQFHNLTFKECNLLNVRFDPSCNHQAIDCLRIEKSFCSHLHPEMNLPACGENCQHVYDQGEQWIVDGVEIAPAVNVYADKITKRIRCTDNVELTNAIWCLEDGSQVEAA